MRHGVRPVPEVTIEGGGGAAPRLLERLEHRIRRIVADWSRGVLGIRQPRLQSQDLRVERKQSVPGILGVIVAQTEARLLRIQQHGREDPKRSRGSQSGTDGIGSNPEPFILGPVVATLAPGGCLYLGQAVGGSPDVGDGQDTLQESPAGALCPQDAHAGAVSTDTPVSRCGTRHHTDHAPDGGANQVRIGPVAAGS